MKRILAATLAVLAVAGLASAQFQTSGSGIRTVVDQLFEFVGAQKFRDNVTVGGNLTVTGTTTQTGAITATGGVTGSVAGAVAATTLSTSGVTSISTTQTATSLAPYNCVSATLNSTAIGAMTTTAGTTLVTGVAGHSYIPTLVAFTKAAGTAYTINSSAKLAVGHITSGFYMEIDAVGLMDQTDLTKKYRVFGGLTSAGDDTSTYDGKDLGILTSAGTFSEAGSDVTARVCYLDVLIP